MKRIIIIGLFGFLGLAYASAENTKTIEENKKEDNSINNRMDDQMMSYTVINAEKTYTYTKEESLDFEDYNMVLKMDNEMMSIGVKKGKTYGEIGNHIKVQNEYQSIIRLDDKMVY